MEPVNTIDTISSLLFHLQSHRVMGYKNAFSFSFASMILLYEARVLLLFCENTEKKQSDDIVARGHFHSWLLFPTMKPLD